MSDLTSGERDRIGRRFRVGDWQVFPARNAIVRGEREVVLEPQVMRLLVRLAEADGAVVTREQLHADLWPDTFVTEKALTGTAWKLRRALGDDPRDPRYIETITKTGYRLVAAVEIGARDGATGPRDGGVFPRPDAGVAGRVTRVADRAAPVADRAARLEDGGAGSADSLPGRSPRRWSGAGVAVASSGLVVAAALIGLSFGGEYDRPAGPAPDAFARALTSEPGHELQGALSPAGDDVAFVRADATENWDIWIRRIGSEAAMRLTDDPARDVQPVWSPDGARIAFLRFDDSQCRLLVKPALGGPERPLAWCSEYVPARVLFGPALAWSPDGRWIAWPWRDSPEQPVHIQLVDVQTGARLQATEPAPGFGDHDPSFSPDGRHLAFSRYRRTGPGDLWVVRLGSPDVVAGVTGVDGEAATPAAGRASSTERRLTHDHQTLLGHAWLPDGRGLIVSSDRAGTYGLWRVGLDGGAPRWLPAPGENLKQPSLSTDGERLVYESWRYDTNIWRVALGTGGADGSDAAARPVLDSSLWDMQPAYSPGGDRIAFISNRGGGYALWVSDVSGGSARQLAFLDGARLAAPGWSPDGSRLVFEAWARDHADLWTLDWRDGTVRRLTRDPGDELGGRYTPDGRWVVFASNRGGDWEIWRVPAGGGSAERVIAAPAWAPRPSHDGRAVYFTRPGRPGLHRAPLDGGPVETVLKSLAPGDRGNWVEAPDGSLIFVDRREDRAGGLARLEAGDGRITPLAPLPTMVLQNQPGLSLSPDGTHVLVSGLDETEADLMLVEGLLGR